MWSQSLYLAGVLKTDTLQFDLPARRCSISWRRLNRADGRIHGALSSHLILNNGHKTLPATFCQLPTGGGCAEHQNTWCTIPIPLFSLRPRDHRIPRRVSRAAWRTQNDLHGKIAPHDLCDMGRQTFIKTTFPEEALGCSVLRPRYVQLRNSRSQIFWPWVCRTAQVQGFWLPRDASRSLHLKTWQSDPHWLLTEGVHVREEGANWTWDRRWGQKIRKAYKSSSYFSLDATALPSPRTRLTCLCGRCRSLVSRPWACMQSDIKRCNLPFQSLALEQPRIMVATSKTGHRGEFKELGETAGSCSPCHCSGLSNFL